MTSSTLEVAADQVTRAAEKLGAIAEQVEVIGRQVSGRVRRAGRAVPALLRDLESAGVTLESVEVHRPTLDDVFLTLTGRSLRDAEAGPETSDDDVPTADQDLEGVAR